MKNTTKTAKRGKGIGFRADGIRCPDNRKPLKAAVRVPERKSGMRMDRTSKEYMVRSIVRIGILADMSLSYNRPNQVRTAFMMVRHFLVKEQQKAVDEWLIKMNA